MLTIDLKNVEEIVFADKAVQQVLPGLKDLFGSWALGRMTPAMRPVARRAVFDFFDRITPTEVEALAEHLGQKVNLIGTYPHLVKHYSFTIDNAEDGLNESGVGSNFFVWRDEGKLYVSSWR